MLKQFFGTVPVPVPLIIASLKGLNRHKIMSLMVSFNQVTLDLPRATFLDYFNLGTYARTYVDTS